MLDNLEGFHIELTNICTLKCPGCSRTQFIKKFPKNWNNKQLNLQQLVNFIDIDIEGKIFNLCGVYGDPIYYDQLFELVDWIKQNGGIVIIGTNGSYKTKQWWTNLCSKLTPDDQIIFAIDGSPNTFTTYRINADWKTIQIGLETTAKSQAKLIWKFIPFAYNQKEIIEVEKFAYSLGVDIFQVELSDRWDAETNHLKPADEYVSKKFISKVNWYENNYKEISPLCKKSNKEHYISADGYYSPCCFISEHNYYYASQFYKNKDLYKISNTNISTVLQTLSNFYSNLENDKHKVCVNFCHK